MQTSSSQNIFVAFFGIVLTAFCVYFFSWFFVYKTGLNNLAIQSEDTIPAMFLPLSIIYDQTFYADKYYDFILQRYPHPDDKSYEKNLVPFYFKRLIGNTISERTPEIHYISAFPLITGILAVPVYYIPLYLGIPITWVNLTIMAHVAAALIVSLSGGFLFILLKRCFDLSDEAARLLTSTYLFATINFALVSQSLWQHGTLQLFVILSLIFLNLSFKEVKNEIHLLLAGLFLSLAILSRPTAALFVPFYVILVLEKLSGLPYEHFTNFRFSSLILLVKGSFKSLFLFFTGFVPSIAFFIWYNSQYFYNISNQGYASQVFTNWLSSFPEGFLGVWLSPSKGILVYSPIFIMSLVGFYFVIRKGAWRTNFNFITYFALILAHTLLIGFWKHWYGGWSFGYRMSADIIPFLILMLVPIVGSLSFYKYKPLFMVLLVISIVIQIYGVIFFDGVWHAAYDKGFTDTEWLWSIKDSEFAFNMRRVLVKFNILERACPQCFPNPDFVFKPWGNWRE